MRSAGTGTPAPKFDVFISFRTEDGKQKKKWIHKRCTNNFEMGSGAIDVSADCQWNYDN